MWFWSSLFFILLALAIQLIFFSHSPSLSRLVPTEGIIVISSSTGGGRELALDLADAGFQVIVGVSSEKEKKSYKYSTNKGI